MSDPAPGAADRAERRWREIAASPEHEIDLAEAALVIAATEKRCFDPGGYLGRIEAMAATLAKRLRRDIATTETILALNHYLFGELGFTGNQSDYYDLRNSCLNDVLDRRLGIPITLSIVYIEVGRRVGLALQGVSFPGHFLVRCPVRDGALILDPYAAGVSLGLDELRERLQAVAGTSSVPGENELRTMLRAATRKEILARMLRNLKSIHCRQGELDRALAAATRIIALDPEAGAEYRERGSLYLELECVRAALTDYQRYLELCPRGADVPAVRARVIELQRLAARLN